MTEHAPHACNGAAATTAPAHSRRQSARRLMMSRASITASVSASVASGFDNFCRADSILNMAIELSLGIKRWPAVRARVAEERGSGAIRRRWPLAVVVEATVGGNREANVEKPRRLPALGKPRRRYERLFSSTTPTGDTRARLRRPPPRRRQLY